MWDKLKDVSSFVLLPTILLYFLGFVCVMSYLSRFGMVTFDMLNARFIVAGIFPLIALASVIYIAWDFFDKLPPSKFFGVENFRSRWLIHLRVFSFLGIATFALFAVMQFGKYRAPFEQTRLEFRGIFQPYDFIADKISLINLSSSVSAEFILKLFLYIFSYLFLLLLICTLIALLYLVLVRYFPQLQIVTRATENTPTAASSATTAGTRDANAIASMYSGFKDFFVLSADVVIISFYIALAIYAPFKLGVELVDFHTFVSDRTLGLSLIFAWLYSSVLAIYLFLVNFEVPAEQLRLNFTKHVHFGSVQMAMHQLVAPLLLSLYFFGATIFPLIPYSIGGGEAREIAVHGRNNLAFEDEKLFLIGESNGYLFVVGESGGGSDGRSLMIDKTSVAYVEVKSPKRKMATSTEAAVPQ